jgi:hypothetical protein
MNKKVCVIFIFILLVLPLILNFVTSQGENSTIFGISSDSGVKLTEKWEYLGKEWKNILMANSVIQSLDSLFQKINFVFLVLFGTPYSLSLALFLIVFLWLYFFFSFQNILKMTLFSKIVCLLISLGLTIILAQVGLFSKIVNFIIQLLFGEQTWWMKLIIGVGILIALVLVFAFVMKFGKQSAINKKKRKDEENRIKLETGAKAGEALSKAVSETGKS